MISFPEGTQALVTDDRARLLKKWNQLWFNRYGNVVTAYPEGTEPKMGDDAHRSLVKIQALGRAAGGGSSYGPELLTEDYDSENIAHFPTLDTNKQYLWTPGANESVFHNGSPFSNPLREDYTTTTIFTPVNGGGFIEGLCANCPMTGSLKEIL